MAGAEPRRVAILQSNYIPWKGYFDLINMVDEFILFDSAQYTRRDWRNRNRIKTPSGPAWLTIPVVVKGRYLQTIQETEIEDRSWNERHWKTLVHNCARALYFDTYRDRFEELYLGCQEKLLSRINYRFLAAICEMLGIKTHLTWSMDYPQVEGKTQRLVEWCKQLEATEYLSGPAAKNYVDERLFAEAGITVRYMDYSGYPEYRQLYPPFDHAVSIVDLIFNEGPNATRYMKSFCAHTGVSP
jgi:WbqC-like protein family